MKMLILVVLLIAGALPGTATAQNRKKPKHPIILEFLKYSGSHDHFVRRDQVERLAKVQTPESVELIVKKGLTDSEDIVREKASWALGQMKTPEARAAVIAVLSSRRPLIRRGVALGLGHMKDFGEAIPPLSQLLLTDGSATVREGAAQALGMLESPQTAETLVKGLEDRHNDVLVAVVDALALIKPKSAARALENALNHSNWRVQVAVLNALSHIRARSSIGPIIRYMDEARGRPRMDARRALMRITQRTFGMSTKSWKDWWGRTEASGWMVPPPKKTERGRTHSVEDADPGRGYSRRPMRYHRITTYSKKLLFVLDISASMRDPILIARGRDTGSRRLSDVATQKLKIAREELAFFLRELEKNARFNVIVFETDVRVWKKEAQRASPSSVQAAIRWVERQKPRIPSGGGRRSSGRDSEGRLTGRTNTYAALRAVYGLPASGRGGVTGGSRRKRKPLWDTVFFLTDGEPTEGEYVKKSDILAEVRRWNKIFKLQINCIGMNATGALKGFLDELARMTGGTAIYLGK